MHIFYHRALWLKARDNMKDAIIMFTLILICMALIAYIGVLLHVARCGIFISIAVPTVLGLVVLVSNFAYLAYIK